MHPKVVIKLVLCGYLCGALQATTILVYFVIRTRVSNKFDGRKVDREEKRMEFIAEQVLIGGKAFSRRALTGIGKPISPTEFSRIQKQFIDSGRAFRLYDRKNSKVLLNEQGRNFLEQFL